MRVPYMAKVSFEGLDELDIALKGITEGVDELADELMKDGADITKQEVERSIFEHGEFKTGSLLRSIKISKRKTKEGNRCYVVRPTGKNSSGSDNGQVAFTRNYGSSIAPGSRFWTKAEVKAVERFEDIKNTKVNLFFKEKGLS